jgi:hypothetical protein
LDNNHLTSKVLHTKTITTGTPDCRLQGRARHLTTKGELVAEKLECKSKLKIAHAESGLQEKRLATALSSARTAAATASAELESARVELGQAIIIGKRTDKDLHTLFMQFLTRCSIIVHLAKLHADKVIAEPTLNTKR